MSTRRASAGGDVNWHGNFAVRHCWLLFSVMFLFGSLAASGTVTAVTLQGPSLQEGSTPNLISPVHFQATAESDLGITGYVIYADNQNVFQSPAALLDAWVVLGPGQHSIYVKAWDSSGALASTATYQVNVTDFAAPAPPPTATRLLHLSQDESQWTVDNDPHVGGECNHGSLAPFDSASDPNTRNSPDAPRGGLHLVVTSKCKYDDSLFYRKNKAKPYPYAGATNFLWDFWFYIPSSTRSETIQALEFDFFQAVELSDGVHEFMFGSQCNYASNQWQLWLPRNGHLSWVDTGLSPCQFASGAWHHAIYFLQRVTASGYQKIPAHFDPASDTNDSLRFGTLTIDGKTLYLGGIANSTTPNWSPTLGIQHQIDSALAGVTIEEYVSKESLIVW